MNPTQQPTSEQPYNPLSAMRENEQILFEIKRHPMGIISNYVVFGLLLVVVAIMAVLAPSILTDIDSQMVTLVALVVFAFTAVLSVIMLFIMHKVYFANRWILTTDSLTQISQNSLFSKQSSQLGMDNLEDVTIEKRGILAHMFNYGIIRCQTAGEQGKFLLSYCPDPEHYARQLLTAREAFEHPNED